MNHDRQSRTSDLGKEQKHVLQGTMLYLLFNNLLLKIDIEHIASVYPLSIAA